MSNWWYVAIAYTVVWGALAAYALLLARRVAQARDVSRRLREAVHDDPQSEATPQTTAAQQSMK